MAVPPIPEREASKQFLGAWKLISFEVISTSGGVQKPFGEHPAGLILYQKNGHMSAQLMQPDYVPFSNPDPGEARGNEIEEAWRKYVGYWGTFVVDRDKELVTHHVEGSWFPNWVGGKQVRAFRFEENHLTLSANLPGGQARLVWERIE
jgi:hypothetical protein